MSDIKYRAETPSEDSRAKYVVDHDAPPGKFSQPQPPPALSRLVFSFFLLYCHHLPSSSPPLPYLLFLPSFLLMTSTMSETVTSDNGVAHPHTSMGKKPGEGHVIKVQPLKRSEMQVRQSLLSP